MNDEAQTPSNDEHSDAASSPPPPTPPPGTAVAAAALAKVMELSGGLAGAVACLHAALRAGANGEPARTAEAWWRERQRQWVTSRRFVTNDLVHLAGAVLEVNSIRIRLRGVREIALVRTLVAAARMEGGRFVSVDELAVELRATADPAPAVQRAVSEFRIKLQALGLAWNLVETWDGAEGLGYRLSTPPVNIVWEDAR